MSVLRSQLVGDVYEYCGNPDDCPLKDKGLPQQFVFQVLTENEDEMLRDLELSDQGKRIATQEVPLSNGQFEFSLNADAADPFSASLQADPSVDIWYPVDIVTPSALLKASQDGVLAVAFRDTPATGETSWQPEAAQNLRIRYQRGGNDTPQMAAATDLGNLYDSYLKLRTAAQCREIMGLAIGEILKSRLLHSEKQWQRYVNKGNQKGLGHKAPAIPSTRRRAYPFVDRTRFFLPR